MTDKVDMNSVTISQALRLAKDGSFEKALVLCEPVLREGLDIGSLRSLALVYSYCGEEKKSYELWGMISRHEEATAGDFYMLGTHQINLGHHTEAINSFKEGLKIGLHLNDARYEGAIALNLCYLLLIRKDRVEAEGLFKRISDEDSDFVKGFGIISKARLLSIFQEP